MTANCKECQRLFEPVKIGSHKPGGFRYYCSQACKDIHSKKMHKDWVKNNYHKAEPTSDGLR